MTFSRGESVTHTLHSSCCSTTSQKLRVASLELWCTEHFAQGVKNRLAATKAGSQEPVQLIVPHPLPGDSKKGGILNKIVCVGWERLSAEVWGGADRTPGIQIQRKSKLFGAHISEKSFMPSLKFRILEHIVILNYF